MQESDQDSGNQNLIRPERRSFLSKGITGFMVAALALSYGSFFSYMARFLYPAKGTKKSWLFLSEVAKMKKGDAISYKAPTGEKIAVARQDSTGTVDDFIALSSTCPHLGCQVHWEGPKNRFFCPCHNGVFNPKGIATSGPPADAKQKLPTYPLKIKKGLLFIEVPMEGITMSRLPPSGRVGGGH